MPQTYDLVCLSHLRWDFVFQRPQHLLSRYAREHRVFFMEEPVFDTVEGESGRLEVRRPDNDLDLWVATPHPPAGAEPVAAQRELLRNLMRRFEIDRFVLWYYTPMALPLADGLAPVASVYDAMDQLSAFKGAPPEMIENEQRLFNTVDLVFTGGHSLYEAKRGLHHSVHAFPSSVDAEHFRKASALRSAGAAEPPDQAKIAHPRAGFFGVIDERLDIDLLASLADLRPGIQFVMIGPVVKIDPASLPQRPNIHYLGGKSYQDLPAYLAGWDVAMMPFALNESTRFISPTKTPEYLAAGCPVVSTAIRDVVRPYQHLGLVRIAANADEFAAAIDSALGEDGRQRQMRVDDFLSRTSWDRTWREMSDLIDSAVSRASGPDEGDAARRATPVSSAAAV